MAVVKAKGNMYPWVTHCHSHLRGACSHGCPYCYVQAIGRRFGGEAHAGPLRLERGELRAGYGRGRTVFIEHSNDLFQAAVPNEWIGLIVDHCMLWPGNVYVFQTRNTERAAEWGRFLPRGAMLGTTIETNRRAPGNAPHPKRRAIGLMGESYDRSVTRFVTVEPVLDFDTDGMLELLDIARPSFVNIGADSKRCAGLAEPDAVKLEGLIAAIEGMGISVRRKTNLRRLTGGGEGRKNKGGVNE